MRFRLLLFALLALAFSPPVFGQSTAKTFTFTGNGQTHCIGTTALPTMGIQATGTFTLTLTPQVSINGQTPQSAQVTPSNSSTAQSTITAAGAYVSAVGGYDTFCLSTTAYTSGTATVQLNPSSALNASLLGGGGTPFAAGGDLSGTATSQEVIGIQDNPLPALADGFLNWNGSDWLYTPGAFSAGIYAWDYGVVGEGHTSVNVVTTTSSAVVTCSDCNFTVNAAPGQEAWITSLDAQGGSLSHSTYTSAGTTILSADSGTQVHLSATVSASCLAHDCTMTWGTPEQTQFAAAQSAAAAACSLLILPGVNPENTGPAMSLFDSGEPMDASSICGEVGVAANRKGLGIAGQGVAYSYLVPTPAMSASSCNGGSSGGACFGGGTDGETFHDFSIYGGGNDQLTGFSGKVGLEVDSANNARIYNVNHLFWGASTTAANSLGTCLQYYGGEITAHDVEVDGCGYVGRMIAGGSNLGPVIDVAPNNYDTFGPGTYVHASSGITYQSFGGQSGSHVAGCINNGALWQSYGDTFGLPGGTVGGTTTVSIGSCSIASGTVTGAGRMELNGSAIYPVGGSGEGLLLSGSTAVARLVGTTIQGNASGSNYLIASYPSNGGVLIDGGGNTFTPGSASLVFGTLTVFGSSSITGTVQTSGNVALTGFGTSPSVGTVSGDSRLEQFTITIGSTPTTGSMVVTFPTPFLAAPICGAQIVNGTNTTLGSFTTGTVSASSAAFTYVGTLVGADTLVVQVSCQ